MAALTVVEIRLAECALAVVTTGAGLCARVREMLRREGRRDLLSFRQSAPSNCMTILATEILSWSVCGVAKAYAIGARCGRDVDGASAGRVAHAAG